MIAELVELKRGFLVKGIFYIELILNQGTAEEPILVSIFIDMDCEPERYLGKEVVIPIGMNSFMKSPNRGDVIYTDKISLA